MSARQASGEYFSQPDLKPQRNVRVKPVRHRSRVVRPALMLLVALVIVGALALVWGLRHADAVGTDGYTYFPTASSTDGKMLCVAGDTLETLSGTTVTVSFSVPATQSTFVMGVFDGRSGNGNAANGQWDQSTASFNTLFTLYADPSGQGVGSVPVGSWMGDSSMAWNAWSDFSIVNTSAALAPSGRCFYTLVASAVDRTTSSVNCFKFRVAGTSYITPKKTFGFIGAANAPLTDTTYDGDWDFFFRVPQGLTKLDVWDGDFDVSGDTNDLNTPSTPPTWSTSAAIAEGTNGGNPADDNIGNAFLRTPNVNYDLYMPDGTRYGNTNPSGNSEWELFRLSTDPTDTAVMDYHVASIPAGLWRMNVIGVDLHNLNALRFEQPVLGVDGNGAPVEPDFPYAIGDRIWLDSNRNGIQDAGEANIPGAVVTLRDGAGSFIATTAADASGSYRFTSLPGTYTIDIADQSNYASGGPLAGLIATTARKITSVIKTVNDLTADFGLARGPALVVSKARAPSSNATAVAGEDTTYVVTVRNVGETTATAVVATDTIVGADLTYVAGSSVASWTGGSSASDPTAPSVSQLRWAFGGGAQIAPGGTLTLSYRLRVKTGATRGAHPDTVTVAANDASGTPVVADCSTWIPADTSPEDSASASVWVSTPGITITKVRSSADATVHAGDIVSYTIVVRNTGDSRISALPLSDTFVSNDLTYVSGGPLTPQVSTDLMYWSNIGPLDPGQQITLTVNLMVTGSPAGYTSGGTATAGPTSDVWGKPVASASASASVDIVRPSLSVTKVRSSSDSTIQVGQPATYRIVVKNDGNQRIASVPLSDVYSSAHLSYTTATPAPSPAATQITTYAVSASDPSGTWANEANSLGAPDGVSASSAQPPFDLSHSFAFPGGTLNLDEATVTVRSRATGFGQPVPGFSITRMPASDGAKNGTWNSNPYYSKVDSNPPNDADMVTCTTNSGGYLLFGFANFGLPSTATNIDVTVYYRARDAANGTNNIRSSIQVGGTVYRTTDPGNNPPNTSSAFQTYAYTYSTNPRSGNAWTVADINGTGGNALQQFGVASNDCNPDVSVSEVYAIVSYDGPGDDTWAIQYSTDSGGSWSDIVSPRLTNEVGLIDHAIDLTGILTAANAAGFRVRAFGSVVGSTDNAGAVDWDSTRLDLHYHSAASPAGSASWDLGPLDPGQQTTVTVSFLATGVPVGAVSVDTATVGPTTDLLGNPVASVADTASVAITRPQIAISKTLAPSQAATVGVGSPVTFKVALTNTGDTTVTAASLVDTWAPTYLQYSSAVPAPGALGSGVATFALAAPLAPGATTTYTVNYTAIAVPPSGGTTNAVATVGAVDANGDSPLAVSSSRAVGIVNSSVSVSKVRTSPDAMIQIGQTATYDLVVRNTGTSTLATVPLTDTFQSAYMTYVGASVPPSILSGGVVTWANVGPLAAGAQTTVTATFMATARPPAVSTVDTATLAGVLDGSGNPVVGSTSTATVSVTRPDVAITKTSLDANGKVAIGSSSAYLIHITNTGDTTIATATVADVWSGKQAWVSASPAPASHSGSVATFTITSLAPGSSRDITVTLSGASAGSAPDTATVTATDSSGDSAAVRSATAAVTVTNPNLAITKTSLDADGVVAIGSSSSYRIHVTNSGDTTISAATVSDTWTSRQGWVSSTPAPASRAGVVATFTVASLAPGASTDITVTLSGTSAGSAPDTAVVSGVDANGDATALKSASAGVTVASPDISITKTSLDANGGVPAGSNSGYRLRVTNTGDTTIATATVTDVWSSRLAWVSATPSAVTQSATAATFTVTSLAPGASSNITVTLSGVATGSAPDTATVVATDAYGNVIGSKISTAVVTVTDSRVSITKTSMDGDGKVAIGSSSSYRIHVTNTGDTTLATANIVDDWTGKQSWVSATPAPTSRAGTTATFAVSSLAPGASTDITVTLAGASTGAAPDTATVTAVDAFGDAVGSKLATAGVTITNPELTFTKTSLDKDGVVPIGVATSYRLRVTNTGNTTVAGATVTDTWSDRLAWVSATPAPVAQSGTVATFTVASLAPGDSADIIVKLSGFSPGSAPDTATAFGVDEYGDTVSEKTATAAVTVTATIPGIAVTKTASRPIVKSGEVVTYTVSVVNSGDTTITTATVSDVWDAARLDFESSTPATVAAPGSASFIVTDLAPGATYPIQFVLRATSTTGIALNTVTVSGTDINGDDVGPKSATATVTVGIRAEITALWSTDAAKIGQNVTIDSTHLNEAPVAISGSSAAYTIWWDTNGDESFDAGDIYIDSAGFPHPYDGVTAVSTHITTGIDVAAGGGTWEENAWTTSNTHFPNQGTYLVTEVWKDATDVVIDTKTTHFYSVPTLGEWMAKVADSGPRSLPMILLAGALWLALTVWLFRTRRWLRMYLIGAFGFVMFVLFFSQALGWDAALEAVEARNVMTIATWLQMRLDLLGSSGLAIRNHVGWGVFDIGIECSALLELAAFVGLVAFYPGFKSGRKTSTIAIGLVATYAINIVRILIIVGMIAALGTSWVFVAHAVVGRVFFFIGVVIVYWYLMTRPTVVVVGAKLDPEIAREDLRG